MAPSKALRLIAGAALVLGIVGCQGGASAPQSFAPYGSAPAVSAPGNAVLPNKDVDIKSSCGRKIHVVVAGSVDCRFHEHGYGDGLFTIHDHTNGLVTISPTQGDRRTKFTVTGVAVGSGYFVVTDANNHKLRVRVRVTL